MEKDNILYWKVGKIKITLKKYGASFIRRIFLKTVK